jgi:hypothetical protein
MILPLKKKKKDERTKDLMIKSFASEDNMVLQERENSDDFIKAIDSIKIIMELDDETIKEKKANIEKALEHIDDSIAMLGYIHETNNIQVKDSLLDKAVLTKSILSYQKELLNGEIENRNT